MFHVKHLQDMTQNELITAYIENLIFWNRHINLVQHDTLQDVYERHVRDCQQICKFLNLEDTIIDIGSGAGLPGVILSIMGYEDVTLCEKNYKKCIFLHELKSKLKLNYKVYNGDVFTYHISDDKVNSAVLVSRAFGSLERLLSVMEKLHVSRGTFHKGRTYRNELAKAMEVYQFDYSTEPSETDPESVIINIAKVRKQ